MKTRMFLLCIAAAFAVEETSAQENWWNRDWDKRVKITLNAGMTPGKEPLASARVAGKTEKINLESARLIDGNGKEVPCLMKQDSCGDYFVAWKPEHLTLLVKRDYCLYFSDTAKNPGTPPEGFPDSFPGMNLIPNADFSLLDADGHPQEWAMSKRGYGLKDKWTEENKGGMKVVTVDGRRALELAADAVVYVNVRAGRQYELSVERKYEAGSLGTTVWYRGKTIHEYLARELNISNYKMQLDAIAPGKWHKSVASTFLYQDNKSRQISYGNRKLLPHTQMAFIQFTVRNGKAWISGIRFEDITDRGSLKVKTGGIERLESKK